MGSLTPEQTEVFQKNPRYIGMKLPETSKPETLEKKYLGKLSKKAMAFMKACLRMDPNQRLTAAEAIQHPYFEGLIKKGPHISLPVSRGESIREESVIVGSSESRKLVAQILTQPSYQPPDSSLLTIGTGHTVQQGQKVINQSMVQNDTSQDKSSIIMNESKMMNQKKKSKVGGQLSNKKLKGNLGDGTGLIERAFQQEKVQGAERSLSLNKPSTRLDKVNFYKGDFVRKIIGNFSFEEEFTARAECEYRT